MIGICLDNRLPHAHLEAVVERVDTVGLGVGIARLCVVHVWLSFYRAFHVSSTSNPLEQEPGGPFRFATRRQQPRPPPSTFCGPILDLSQPSPQQSSFQGGLKVAHSPLPGCAIEPSARWAGLGTPKKWFACASGACPQDYSGLWAGSGFKNSLGEGGTSGMPRCPFGRLALGGRAIETSARWAGLGSPKNSFLCACGACAQDY